MLKLRVLREWPGVNGSTTLVVRTGVCVRTCVKGLAAMTVGILGRGGGLEGLVLMLAAA